MTAGKRQSERCLIKTSRTDPIGILLHVTKILNKISSMYNKSLLTPQLKIYIHHIVVCGIFHLPTYHHRNIRKLFQKFPWIKRGFKTNIKHN